MPTSAPRNPLKGSYSILRSLLLSGSPSRLLNSLCKDWVESFIPFMSCGWRVLRMQCFVLLGTDDATLLPLETDAAVSDLSDD